MWSNPRPASTRFCRPVRLQWLRETDEISKLEKNIMDKEISKLKPFNKYNCKISFSIHLTMIDSKISNALTNTSSMCCNICKAKISEMNNLKSILNKKEDETSLQFSLPILHSYIHFFDSLLHISYRLDFKKWRATKEDGKKIIMENRKKIIQDRFLKELGLRVDFPKCGFGSSNDGNTARRFFENHAKSAEITGIDEKLIERYRNILIIISCGRVINYSKFKTYCIDTAKLYVSLYPWYYMSPTVHKILIHGPSVAKNCILPIGCFTEEVLETCHKLCKLYRRAHSQKTSRTKTNQDIFHRLLLHSDPYISLSEKIMKKKKDIPSELFEIVTDTEEIIYFSSEESTCDSDDSE